MCKEKTFEELVMERVVRRETLDGCLYEYDENNNLIHCKGSNEFEYWYEYDSNNNIIHYKDSNGYESWKEYNENNKLTHYKDYDGHEYWKEYDENNKLIHCKDSNGEEYWYDSKGNEITKEEYDKLYNIHKEISDDDLQYYKLIYKYTMNSIDLMKTIINDIKNTNLPEYEHLKFNNLCLLHDRYYNNYKECIEELKQGSSKYNIEFNKFLKLLK